jgi:hypothetical protein
VQPNHTQAQLTDMTKCSAGPELDQEWDYLARLHSVAQIGLDHGLVTQDGLDYGQA